MVNKNYISVAGNGNILLQDINGKNININDIASIKSAFENTEPEYIKQLHRQIDNNFHELNKINKKQINIIISFLTEQIKKQRIEIKRSKNVLTGTISDVVGNVHIGDIHYNSENNNKNVRFTKKRKTPKILLHIVYNFIFILLIWFIIGILMATNVIKGGSVKGLEYLFLILILFLAMPYVFSYSTTGFYLNKLFTNIIENRAKKIYHKNQKRSKILIKISKFKINLYIITLLSAIIYIIISGIFANFEDIGIILITCLPTFNIILLVLVLKKRI